MKASRTATAEISAYFQAMPTGKLRVIASGLHSEYPDVRKPAKRIEKVTEWAILQGLKAEPIGATEETSPHSYVFTKA